MITIEDLHIIRLLEGMSSEQLAQTAPMFNYKTLMPDEHLIQHTSSDYNVYFLLEGKLLASVDSSDGKSVIYRHFEIGDTVGDYSAIDLEPRSATVKADGPVKLASLTQANFMTILKTQPQAALNEISHLVHNLRGQAERIFELSTQATMDRLKAELIRMAEQKPVKNKLVIHSLPRQSVIAARIGSHREAVSRHLVKLERDGLITRSGDSLVIESPKDLIAHIHVA